MAEINPVYANLAPYQQAVGIPNQVPLNLLDSLISGFNQGSAIRNAPQTLQDQQLARQLTNAINQQKLFDLQNPDQALARQVQQKVALEAALNPSSGYGASDLARAGITVQNPQALSPEQNASLPSQDLMNQQQLAFKTAGVPIPALPSAEPLAPTTPISVLGNQIGYGYNPNIPAQEEQNKLDNQIKLLNARPETFRNFTTDQGIFGLGNRGTVIPLNAPGTNGATLTAPPKVGSQVKMKQFTDSQGYLMQQPTTGGPASAVLDANGDPINVGIANHVVNSDQGPVTIPSKSNGAPTATPITTSQETGGTALTKTGINAEKLSKDVQSNKPYQTYVAVSSSTKNLQDALDYAKSNPADQTGIKTKVVDAFNLINNSKGVVRQTAFAQTTAGQSLLNKADNFFKGLATGQTITIPQIESLLKQSQASEIEAKKSAQEQLDIIKNRGDKVGIDPTQYLPGSFNGQPSISNNQIDEALKWVQDPQNANNPWLPKVKAKLGL